MDFVSINTKPVGMTSINIATIASYSEGKESVTPDFSKTEQIRSKSSFSMEEAITNIIFLDQDEMQQTHEKNVLKSANKHSQMAIPYFKLRRGDYFIVT